MKSTVFKIMKLFLIIVFIFISALLFGQNKHLSIGINGNGICFGNAVNNNGIRLNLWDQNTNRINGLNISGKSGSKNLNGISAGILVSTDSISNGIEIGGLVAKAKKHNGFAFGCLGLNGTKFNGIGLSGLVLFSNLGAALTKTEKKRTGIYRCALFC